MRTAPKAYIPPLRFHFLTRFYDVLVRWTTREEVFKEALLAQLGQTPGERLLGIARAKAAAASCSCACLHVAVIHGLRFAHRSASEGIIQRNSLRGPRAPSTVRISCGGQSPMLWT
jgi:hypothetical protein